MKRITASVLLVIAVFSLFSCSNKYKPVKSTKEEAKVVLTLEVDNEEYEIKYELYRAFFLNYKSEIDKGDASVWSSDRADEYINKINKKIISSAATIYSALHLAEQLGIDPYSRSFENRIDEYVRIGVEGNGAVTGHGGDYDAYLASLKKMNLNYSVSILLIRYQLALEAINEYYTGRVDEVLGNIGGDAEIKTEDVEEYYYSDECARILYVFYQDGVKTDEQLEKIKSGIEASDSDLSAAEYIIGHSFMTGSELIKDGKVTGTILGKYVLDEIYYSEYTDAAMSLAAGQTSEIIKIKGDGAGAYIIYKLAKGPEHFSAEYDKIRTSYIDNLIGKKLHEISTELSENSDFDDKYSEIDHSNISMG